MKIRIVSAPKMAANGLQVEGNQATPISDNMLMLGGKTHEEGGTDISYNGQQVEAEKGEPVSIGKKGEAIVWGNVHDSVTGTKFKNAAKKIGEEEDRNNKMGAKAGELIANNSPDNKWDRLAFNSGRIMQIGALQNQKEINEEMDAMADRQRAILEVSHANNLDPQALGKGDIKKAKKGAFLPYKGMKAADGTDLGQDPPKKKKYNPGFNDETNFLKPGYQPMQTPDPNGVYYNNFGAQTQFNPAPPPPPTKNQKVAAAVNPVYNQPGMTPEPLPVNQGQPYGTPPGGPKPGIKAKYSQVDLQTHDQSNPHVANNDASGQLPYMQLSPEVAPQTYDQPHPDQLGDVDYTPRGPLPSNVQALNLNQIAPELYGFATNKQVPVALQKYNPQTYVPYQMSFQDRLNDNAAEANQLYRRSESNPALASAIGAGVYDANNKVRAEEFRTNQGIQADTINKNVNLLNDAQLKNLQLADTQYTRQSEARSRTREINQAIMNSVASKYAQNDLNNKKLAAFENLYDYRFNDTNNDRIPDTATYYGPQASFHYNPQSGGQGGANPYSRTVVQTDNKGHTITRVITPSEQDEQYKDLNIQKRGQEIYPRKNLLNKLFGPRPANRDRD